MHQPGRKEGAIPTFDLAEVRRFAADLDARLERCDNGEGVGCANLDDALRHYAKLCCEFCEEVRRWGRAVFAGQVAFDPAVEQVWLDEGVRLHQRASELWAYGREKEGVCFVLEGGAALGSALWYLEQMLAHWVTPKRAVAPLARLGLASTPTLTEETRERIEALRPLPADWQPADPRQRVVFRHLQRRKP